MQAHTAAVSAAVRVPADPSFVGRIEDEIEGLDQLLNVGKLQSVLSDILHRLGRHEKQLVTLQEWFTTKPPQDDFEGVKVLLREVDLLARSNEKRLVIVERDLATRPTAAGFEEHTAAIKRLDAAVAERPNRAAYDALAASVQKSAAEIARLERELCEVKKAKVDKVVVDDLIAAQHKANEELAHMQKQLADKASRAEHLNLTARMDALALKFDDLSRCLTGDLKRVEARAANAEAAVAELAKRIDSRAGRDELDKLAQSVSRLWALLNGKEQTDRSYLVFIEDVRRYAGFVEEAARRLAALEAGQQQLWGRKAEASDAEATARRVDRHDEELAALRPLLAVRPSVQEMAATVPEHTRAIEELERTKASLAELAEKLGRGDLDRLREETRRAYEEAYARLRAELADRFRRLELDGDEIARLQEAIDRLLARLQEKADREELARLKRILAPLFDANGNFSSVAYKCIACDSASPVLGVKGLMRVAGDTGPGLPPKGPSSALPPASRPAAARSTSPSAYPSSAFPPSAPKRPLSAPKARLAL